ncbi:hypothetical protein PUN28_012400 [Cardiocondyla obscurior]|uniref:Uncharacterized protein n=1 Tax=Cardiocondyla obscurior TaxID=286306 RepID=A0AAW2FB84_9HYME
MRRLVEDVTGKKIEHLIKRSLSGRDFPSPECRRREREDRRLRRAAPEKGRRCINRCIMHTSSRCLSVLSRKILCISLMSLLRESLLRGNGIRLIHSLNVLELIFIKKISAHRKGCISI